MAKKNTELHLISESTRRLPCHLTDEEVLRAGSDLAQVIEDMSTEESRAQDVRAQLKAQMTEYESRRSQLASKVRRREEYRDVKVSLYLQDDSMVVTVREDTGEQIEVRPAHESELQAAMAFDDEAA